MAGADDGRGPDDRAADAPLIALWRTTVPSMNGNDTQLVATNDTYFEESQYRICQNS